MSLTPLIEAAPAVQLHTIAALAALIGGPLQALLPKDRGAHRWAGYLWVATMAIVALTSFGIESRWPIVWRLGPIHLLSVLTLIALPYAVWAARSGQPQAHRAAMISIWLFALVIPGASRLRQAGS